MRLCQFWLAVLTDLRKRGVADVFFLVDGLKGMPQSVNAVWPATIVQTGLIHLILNSFRFASRKSDQGHRGPAGCCDSPQAQVSHLHSNSGASRRRKPVPNAFADRMPTKAN
jgi:transposase-like protein